MDRDNDGVITRAEWRGSARSFEIHDWNGDGVLSGDEVMPRSRRSDRRADDRDDRDDDWGNYRDDDWDRRGEFSNWTAGAFNRIDANRDNRITADEWQFDRASFRRADHNGDGVITKAEFLNDDRERFAWGTEAYRRGYERGLSEGRSAGGEDRERNQGWDLEGQRELEQADSGFDARFGPRPQYQAGYREGFRRGYHEGFGR